MLRLLYLTHRWIGVALALLMLLWFSSGLIIVLSGSTTQTRARQLAHAESLSPETGWLSLGEAWRSSAEARSRIAGKVGAAGGIHEGHGAGRSGHNGGGALVEGRLRRVAGEPVWLAEDDLGRRFAISAISGKLVEFSDEQAELVGRQWAASEAAAKDGGAAPSVAYLETLESVVGLHNFEAIGPFHRLSADDGAGTELYVAARTGEVLKAGARLERGVSLAGAWLHMFHPFESVGLGAYRRDALAWSAFFAAVASLTGLVIGWLRWRPGFRGKPTYSQGRTQPYREFWQRYHFWVGLIGGGFALAWATSGFLVTNPLGLFSPANASREEFARYRGGSLPSLVTDWRPDPAIGAEGADVVELGWSRIADKAALIAYARDGRRLPLPVAGAVARFEDGDLLAAARRLGKDAPTASHALLSEYDDYYYPSRRQGPIEKPLPVLRVELADAGRTTLYLDPVDGRLLAKQDQSRRVHRWLYSALHHWDFGWLARRPLWDAWVLTWIGFGLVLSASSVALGWRRLRRTFGAETESSTKRAPEPSLAPAPLTDP